MFSLLKDSAYLRFWLAGLISQFGDGIARMAIMVIVASLTDNPVVIGSVIFVQLLPSAVFGIFMGPLADRLNRKRLMIGTDLYRLMIVLLMIPLHHSIIALMLLIILQGIGTSLFEPSRSASIPALVGQERITQAMSLSQSTTSLIGIIGPSVAALLLAFNQFSAIFMINAITYGISAVLLLSITSWKQGEQSTSSRKENYLQSLRGGVKEVTGIPALRFLLILIIPVSFVVGVINTNLVTVLTITFAVPPSHFGAIQSGVAIGALCGAMVLGPFLMKKLRPSTVLVAGTASIGFWMIGLILVDSLRSEWGLAPIYIWCTMIGVLNALINIPLSSLFLGTTPAAFRGRGSSLFGATGNSSVMIGLLGGGWLALQIGTVYSTAAAGALLALTIGVFPLLRGYGELHGIGAKKTDKAEQTMEARTAEG